MIQKKRPQFLFIRLLNTLTLMLVLFSVKELNAQYRVNKHYYDYRAYTYQTGDPYHPVACGIASYIAPGVGQVIASEPLRGLAFLTGYAGCWVACGLGFRYGLNAYSGVAISP